MNFRLRVLLIAILASILLIPQAFAGYVAEDLGLDMYSKIDKGSSAMRVKLIKKRVTEGKFTEQLNLTCSENGSISGKTDNCFTNDPFTIDELELISDGNNAPIFLHLKEKFQKSISTDKLLHIARVISESYQRLLAETKKEQENIETMGSLGIYTDGSLDNSSFDLMTDLKDIHKIIFLNNEEYPGVENDSSANVDSFLDHVGFPMLPIPEDVNPDGTPTTPTLTTGNHTPPPATTAPLAKPLPTALCATGTSTIGGIDESLKNDIILQLLYGQNSNTTSTQGSNGTSGNGTTPGSTPSRPVGSGKDSSDKFPCKEFFCIKIEFEKGTQKLLVIKNATIESLLDASLKVVDTFQDSWLVQAVKPTNGFFTPNTNLQLSKLVHLGVVVSRRPPPILNLNAADTPRGSGQDDNKREFDEIKKNILKDRGFSEPRRMNSIEDLQNNLVITNLAGLSTDTALEKFNISKKTTPRGVYLTSKQAEIIGMNQENFSNEILELRGFTKSLSDYFDILVSLTKKMDAIPQQ